MTNAAAALDRAAADERRLARAVKEASNRLAELSKSHAQEARSLELSRSKIEASMQAAIAPLKSQLQQKIEAVKARQKSIDQREAAERHTVTMRHSPGISVAQSNIAHIQQQEGLATSAEVRRLQRECVERALRMVSILQVSVNRTHPLHLLRSAGITTLLEADPRRVLRVRGVGEKTNAAIQHHRIQVEAQAMRSAPQTLDPAQYVRISAPFVSRRVTANQEHSRLIAARDEELQRIMINCESERADVAAVLSQAELDFSTAEKRVRTAYGTRLADCGVRLARAAANRVKVESVAESVLADARKAHFSTEFVRQRMLRDFDRLKCLRFKAYVCRIFRAA